MLAMDVRISKNESTPWRIIEDEAILLNVDKSEVIHLNEVGTTIWRCLDGEKTVSQIIESICRRFDVGRDSAKKDVLEFLDELIKEEVAGY